MAFALISWFSSLGYFTCDMPAMAQGVIVVAALATLVESLPINEVIDDNISVPAITMVASMLLLTAAASS